MSEKKSFSTEKAARLFLNHMRTNDASPATIDAYGRDLRLLALVLNNPTVAELAPVCLDIFFASHRVVYLADNFDRRRSKSSINRIKATVKTFCKWMVNADVCEKNPARMLKIKKVISSSPNTMTATELKILRKAVASRNGPIAARDKVMLAILIETGIRLSEIVKLNVDDVDLTNKKITIHAKGGKQEQRFINSPIRRLLLAYLKSHTKITTTEDCLPLFLSTRKSRITARQVERRFKTWLAWSGIREERFSIHSLRHTFATELMKKTGNLLLVSKALGHKSIQTTTVYAKLTDDAIENALETV